MLNITFINSIWLKSNNLKLIKVFIIWIFKKKYYKKVNNKL